MEKTRNILLIVTDQHYAEAMSCLAGSRFLQTPSLDRLAQQSMRFSRAYTASPVCIPARNAMFTGLYPHQTGILCNRSHPRNPSPVNTEDGSLLPPAIKGMGCYFADAGYETAYFGKWHLNFDEQNKQHHGFAVTGVLKNTGHDPEIADATANYLRSEHDRPFLAVASFCDPHDICQWADKRPLPGGALSVPPEENQLPPAPANAGSTRNGGDILALLRDGYGHHVHVPYDVDTPDAVRKCRELAWAYYRLIERVDAHIGTILDALEESGHADDTLIVYTSDHGELLGAHGLVQKSFFYEEAVHVPLLVSSPDSNRKSCDRLVNASVDLLPTLLESVGIIIPDHLSGRSLCPLVNGGEISDWRDAVIGEVHFCQPRLPEGTPRAYGRMVRTPRYSYWLFDHGQQRELLFDTEDDPGETCNLASSGEHGEILHRHRALLTQHAEQTDDAQATQMLRAIGFNI